MINPPYEELEMDYVIPETVLMPGKSEAMPVIVLSGDVNSTMVMALRQGINKLRERDETTLFVYVTSTGGDPACGRVLFQTLRQLRLLGQYDIYVVAMGAVISAGLYPFLAVPVEKRLALRDTRIGIHLSQAQLNIAVFGNAQMRVDLLRERLSEAEAALHSNELMIEHLAEGSKFSRNDLWELALRYYEPSPEEAVEKGLIGEILDLNS